MKMTQSLALHTTSGLNLIGGGTVNVEQIESIRKNQLPLYCADAGYFHAQQAGLQVSGLIGDLDSVGDLPDVPFPVVQDLDQDTTDLEKSLAKLRATYLLCYGFLGGRMDHSLAAFNAIAKSNQSAFLIGEHDVCAVCPPELALELPVETRFSLFPMSPATARSTGLKWEVDGVNLSPVGIVSTSNMTKEPQITINIDTGVVLAIFSQQVLATVIEQWPFNIQAD